MSPASKYRLKIILAVVALTVGTLGVWAVWIEPDSITVRNINLTIPSWHAEHSQMKIAVLTDLHVGAPHMSLEKLRRVVERTNAEQPTLVLLLGDFVIGGRDHRGGVVGGAFVTPEPIAEELKHLRAPLGIFAVLGNHDWWYDGGRVTKALEGVGVKVLENGAVHLSRDNQSFWLVGIADLWTRQPDIAGSLRQIDGDDPALLMTHNPDIFPDVPARVSLTLAGHTHGGQVNLPFIGTPIVPSKFGQRYALGHVSEQGRHLFVSGGIGTSIVPVRFRVPPEIVILTLSQ